MTTTGGPEHFLADPASSNESADDPVVLRHEPKDGDDIVVEPVGPVPHPRRRTRELVVGIVVAVLAATGVAVSIAMRHDSGGNTHVTTAAPARTPAGHPTAAKSPVKEHPEKNAKTRTTPRRKSTTPATSAAANIIPPATPLVVPPAVSGQSPGSVAPGATVPTAPPATMPPAEPPSALEWAAKPSTLSIKSGGHALLTVIVMNPTAGTVTLGHPLSCPPALQRLHGAPLGSVVCAEIAQIVSPHARLVQHYTIYATDTGAAGGTPLPAGEYLANVENLHNVKVKVTAK